jgi:hypothetical protein
MHFSKAQHIKELVRERDAATLAHQSGGDARARGSGVGFDMQMRLI